MPHRYREYVLRLLENRDALTIIAERLRTKGAVTLRDIEVLLRQLEEDASSAS